jgi:hypothetical protein
MELLDNLVRLVVFTPLRVVYSLLTLLEEDGN